MDQEKKNKRALFVLIVMFIISLLATGITGYPIFLEKEPLVVAMNTPFAPFEWVKGEKIVGFDPDLANAIAKNLGRSVEIKDFSDYHAVLPAVKNGDADVAISGITITPERSESLDFSIPYYEASQAVVINSKDSRFTGREEIESWDFVGMRIGFQEFTTSQSWVETNLKDINLSDTVSYGDLNIAILSLRGGRIDVLIMDEPVAREYARNSDITIAGVIDTGEKYAVAVPKGDPQGILDTINETILELKETGEYDEMINKHFEVE